MSKAKKIYGSLTSDIVEHYKIFNCHPDRIIVSHMLFSILKASYPNIVIETKHSTTFGNIQLVKDITLTGLQYRFEDKKGIRYAEKIA